jgi:hypothetical protein
MALLENEAQRLRIWEGSGRDAGGEVGDQELLEDVACGGDDGTDAGAFEGECAAGAVGGWIVEVGNCAGGEAAEDGGVV